MGIEDDRCRWDLVDVAHLETDDPIFDVVDDPDPVAASDLGDAVEQLYERQSIAIE